MENRDKIKDEINMLEMRKFVLQMIDHWDSEDYEIIRDIDNKVRELKEKLNIRDSEK